MSLVAYRPEYRIRVDEGRNQLVYERLEELTLATTLPHYISDFERALTYLRVGFTMLSDLRRTLGPNVQLIPVFLRKHELLLEAGIGIVAEVHPTAPTMRQISRVLREQSKLPVKLFTSRTEAEAFLEGYRLGLAS